MNKIPHNVLLSVSIIVTITVVALYVYMHYAIQASISRAVLGGEIVRVEKESINQEASMKDTYLKTVEERKKVINMFISSLEAVSFIESIEKLGSYTGSDVVLSSVKSDSADSMASNSFAKINAHLEVSGSWTAVMRALHLAETLPYQVSMSNIKLNSSGFGKDVKKTWKLSFDIASNLIVAKNATSSVSE